MKNKTYLAWIFFFLISSVSPLQASSEKEGFEKTKFRFKETRPRKNGKAEPSCGKFDCLVPTQMGVYTNLEFLFWRASNQGFSPAAQTAIVGDVETYQIERMDTQWKPGLRASLGLNTAHHLWTVFGTWTYYYNRSVQNRQMDVAFAGGINAAEGFYAYWQFSPQGQRYLSYQSVWKLNYNVADLEVKKLFALSQRFSLEGHVGARTAWIYQHFGLLFSKQTGGTTTTTGDVQVQGISKFWGIGPKIGVDGIWNLGMGVRLLAEFFASALYGEAGGRNSIQEFAVTGSLNPSGVNTELRTEFWQLVPNLQTAIGVDWSLCFGNNNRFIIGVAWELNYWWNQLKMMDLDPGTTQGLMDNPAMFNQPLIMDGLRANVSFDF